MTRPRDAQIYERRLSDGSVAYWAKLTVAVNDRRNVVLGHSREGMDRAQAIEELRRQQASQSLRTPPQGPSRAAGKGSFVHYFVHRPPDRSQGPRSPNLKPAPEQAFPKRARHDSNVRPLAPEASALSSELRARAPNSTDSAHTSCPRRQDQLGARFGLCRISRDVHSSVVLGLIQPYACARSLVAESTPASKNARTLVVRRIRSARSCSDSATIPRQAYSP
jgi:hypothetical protein